jgi:predicted metal-dependent phosphoesterase TrpH
MEYQTKSIASRIEWCRRQKIKARAQLELEGWQAEEEGLRDALLNSNHTNQYQHCAPGVFKRYVMGFQDGQALIHAASVDQHVPTPAHRTHV